MSKKVFGVDVGGTSVKLGLFESDGTLIEKWSIPTRTEEEGKYVLPDIAETIKAKISEKNYSDDEVEGVGIGLPGPVDDEGFIKKAVNLHWDRVFNVSEELSSHLGGMKVKAGNDANVAALGEAWAGSGKGYRNIVMVTLGTGIGGGIIIDGKMYSGASGSAGEIGHIHISDEEIDACNCGNHGCLEQFGSATGIVRLLKEELEKSSEPSLMRDAPLTAKDMWEAVKKGDALAVRVAEKFGAYLGKGLAVIAGVVNPELFIIGGGVSMSGDVILPFITDNFNKYVFHACRDVKFVRSVLGNDGGIYGAAKLVL